MNIIFAAWARLPRHQDRVRPVSRELEFRQSEDVRVILSGQYNFLASITGYLH